MVCVRILVDADGKLMAWIIAQPSMILSTLVMQIVETMA